jgi:hypothetical protein
MFHWSSEYPRSTSTPRANHVDGPAGIDCDEHYMLVLPLQNFAHFAPTFRFIRRLFRLPYAERSLMFCALFPCPEDLLWVSDFILVDEFGAILAYQTPLS